MSITLSEANSEEIITTSASIPEDANEGSLRPKTLTDYIGQEKAKGNLEIFMHAAKMRGEPLDHVLLAGPPGLGKTSLSFVIANEMNVNMRITSGPAIEKHEAFPGGVNAEFVQVLSGQELMMRVWERGAAVTLACGTGSCASLVAGVLTGRTERNAEIELDGGTLQVEWAYNNHLFMTGPAELVFTGNLDI